MLEHVVELLRTAELVHLVQRRRYRRALPGGPAAYWGTRGHHSCLLNIACSSPARTSRVRLAIVPGKADRAG
ncbi:hypothetical protein GCM10010246_42430 [Streptomyces cuspidosporus]|uniref:Uncharacterized protein n=1 Tax=Streptomyces cuspidosporus TaxID=66882 RepID=A0ABN3GF20_9ACTN